MSSTHPGVRRVAAAPVPDGVTGARSRDLVPIALAGAAVLVFYILPWATRGLRIPVADDSFYYVSAFRAAGALGLGDAHLAARPAYPLVGGVLATLTSASPWAVAVALPTAVAAGLAMAMGALVRRWGCSPWAAALVTVLAGLSVVTSRLMLGKSENLATLWLLAVLLVVVASNGGRRAFVGATILALAAGLTESPFLAAFAAVVVVAEILRRLAERRGGLPGRTSSPVVVDGMSLARLLAAVVIGGAATGLAVFVVLHTPPSATIQKLIPSFLYRDRLMQEIGLMWPLVSVPLLAMGWWVGRRVGRGPRQLHLLLETWAALTVLVLLVGLVGLRLPTYRATTFALPVALGIAAAPFLPAAVAAVRPSIADRRWPVALAAVVLAALSVMPAAVIWYRDVNPRLPARELGQIQTAWSYAETLPGSRPVILVVDKANVTLSDFYQVVADAVGPPERTERVLVFLGRSSDLLAGHPTTFRTADEDRLARQVFDDVRSALESGAPILAGRTLDPEGFSRVRTAGGQILGDTIAVVRGPRVAGVPATPALRPVPPAPTLLWEAVAMLVLLVLCGVGWSRILLPDVTLGVQLGAAPALGFVNVAVVALVFERLGADMRGGAAIAVFAIAAASSALALLWSTLRPGRRPETLPRGDPSAPRLA